MPLMQCNKVKTVNFYNSKTETYLEGRMHKKTTALVIKPIELQTNPPIVIPVDSSIIIDTDNMVALWQETHFDVFRDEFTLVN